MKWFLGIICILGALSVAGVSWAGPFLVIATIGVIFRALWAWPAGGSCPPPSTDWDWSSDNASKEDLEDVTSEYEQSHLTGINHRSTSDDDDDMRTNPIYSHLSTNIHHSSFLDEHGSSSSFDDDCFSSINSSPCMDDSLSNGSSSDWYTDPIYSHMPGNIYYSDDNSITSSSDDSFSGIDDSIGSSAFDYDNLSAMDDSFSSSSSFDDDTFPSMDDSFGSSSLDDDNW